MSDFNFFDPYKSKQFRSGKTNSIAKIVLIFLTFVLIGFSGFEFYTKTQLESELKEKEDFINSEVNKQRIEERKVTIQKKEDLQKEKSSYTNLDIITKLANEATSDKFSNVVLNNVYGIFLKAINIGNGQITLEVRASDMDKAANYEASLRNTGMFYSVFTNLLSESPQFDIATKDKNLENTLKAQNNDLDIEYDANVFLEKIYPIAFTLELKYNQTQLKAEDIMKIFGNEATQKPENETEGENTEPTTEEENTEPTTEEENTEAS